MTQPSSRRSSTIVVLTILATLALAPAATAHVPRPGTAGSRSRPKPTTASRSSRFGRTVTTCARSPTSTATPLPRTGRRTAAGSPSRYNDCSVGIMDADGGDLQPDRRRSRPLPERSVVHARRDAPRVRTLRLVGDRGSTKIWSMKPDGSDKRFVTGAGETDPNVSPDGAKLSFKDSDVEVRCGSRTWMAAASSRSRPRSRSPTSTTGRPTGSTSCSATTPNRRRPTR